MTSVLPRRTLLGAALLAPLAPARAFARRPLVLPPPELGDDRVLRRVAGLRPWRDGGIRLERELVGGKAVIHNYGHGGAGITLSWGSAEEAVALLPAGTRGPIAVAGAGVVGLTTAHLLLEHGFTVRLYARALPPHTTSDLAGAEWSPDLVEPGQGTAERARFERIVRRSWQRFQRLVGPRWGVWRRPSYQLDGVPSALASLPAGLMAPGQAMVVSLPGGPRPAIAFRTLLIEPPRFLPALLAAARSRGVTVVERTFTALAELGALPEPVVFDCLGLGAGAVTGDRAVRAIKGHLIHLRPQPLGYLLDHPAGYIFPRSDALVVGGSFEEGRTDDSVDATVCARILAANRRFFGV